MAYGFDNLFMDLETNYYLTDALLPFILIFVIVFAVFQKTNILGTDKRNFNIVVATVMSLMAVIPHLTGRGVDVIEPMKNALPQVSIVAVAIIMALLLIGLLGGEAKWMGGSLSGFIAFAAFLTILYIFGSTVGWWERWPRGWWDSETTSIVIVVLVFAIVIWYITKEPASDQKAGAFLNSFEKLGDMFKK